MSAIALNMEWMFTEREDTADRIRAAREHGYDQVEIWGWRAKDIGAVAAALDETGVHILSMIVDPQLQLTDPATHEDHLRAVAESLEVAERLGVPNLVVVAGNDRPGVPRDTQRDALVDVLTRGAALLDGTSVTLLLENLNGRVDHVGTFLTSVREGLDIIRTVGSPHLRLLLDAYHALVMEEDIVAEVGGDVGLVGHVQVADVPGRHEPGTGTVDWRRQLAGLRDLGYRGSFGMEYLPTVDSGASLRAITAIVDDIDVDRPTASRM
jgi:hydroxypyruvate isomerase